ncbi:MAG: PKD domain-containing protein, partial [Saprospiraceae bacterium]
SITIYVRAGAGGRCSDFKKLQLLYKGIDLSYNKSYMLCEVDSVNFTITNNRLTDILNITWKPANIIVSGQGTLNPIFKLNRPGQTRIYFMVTNQFGCMFSDSIDIGINASIKPDMKVDFECGNPKIKVSTAYNGKFRWNFGDGIGSSTKNMDEYTYSKSGKYVITLTADTLCAITNSVTIDISLDDLILRDSISACGAEDIIFNINPNLKYKYRWSPDSSFENPNVPSPTLKIKKSGVYCVDYMDTTSAGCMFRKCIVLTYIDILILNPSFKDTTICNPAIIDLHVNSNFPDIRWCDKNGQEIGKGSKLTVEVGSDTLFVVKGLFSGCNAKDTIRIKLPKFNSVITGPDLVCPGDTIMLQLDPTDANWTYEWTPSDKIIGSNTGSKITASSLVNTNYTVKVKNNTGCEWTASHNVDVSDIGKIVFATADPSVVVIGQKTQLTTIYNIKFKYKWAPDDGSLSSTTIYNPIAMPMKTTTYTVTVTDENGCSSSASVAVTVLPCNESVFIPNAFSP